MQRKNSNNKKSNVEDVVVLFESPDRSLSIVSIPATKLEHMQKTYFISFGYIIFFVHHINTSPFCNFAILVILLRSANMKR